MDKEKLLKIAREFGGEARANDLSSFPTKADREDLAHYAEVKEWTDLSEEFRKELMIAFREGHESESKNHI